ncbi:MAG: hypothetical protein HQL23_04815 [Candidatus Omnitrophica bacterium]|nr:hypothetical protein [Candidatus Omnitrophota bacterium]
MTDALPQNLDAVLAVILKDTQTEVVELNIRAARTETVIDLLVDKIAGGISMEECGQINRRLREGLTAQGWNTDAFVIQVASPGLDRPLKTVRDFSKVLGRMVRIHLNTTFRDRIEYIGIVVKVTEPAVSIEDKKREVILIPFDKIQKAVQIIE